MEPPPSTVTLPTQAPPGVATIFDFFLVRFPHIPAEIWRRRFAEGKVFTAAGPVAPDERYRPLLEVHYRREVEHEPPVRTDWRIVHADEHLLVVDKPPFLPVTPAGAYVRHCLLQLLVEATGNPQLAPLHRIDKDTSGLVVLSAQLRSRGHFGRLFQDGAVRVAKEYLAVCENAGGREVPATLAGHVARDPAAWWRQAVLPDHPDNARIALQVVDRRDRLVMLRVRPMGGRKHQIRVLLAHAVLPIVGDRIYGQRPRYEPDVLDPPMLLDCNRLEVGKFPGFAGTPTLTAVWETGRSFESLLAAAGLAKTTGRI